MIAETHHIEAELRFDGSDGTPHYLFERVLAWDTEGRAHVPCSDTGRLVPLDRVAGIETSDHIAWTGKVVRRPGRGFPLECGHPEHWVVRIQRKRCH